MNITLQELALETFFPLDDFTMQTLMNRLNFSPLNPERGGASAMLSWQAGRVKISRIVEMGLPVPIELILQATTAELRKSAWLYPMLHP